MYSEQRALSVLGPSRRKWRKVEFKSYVLREKGPCHTVRHRNREIIRIACPIRNG